MQAFALADIEVNFEVERIRAWRFRKVSEYMRRLNKDALFSATACRERYNAIVDGTARIPTEMDDDPDTRRSELETYRVAREEARLKEQAEKDAQEAKERKAKEKARTLNAQKAEEVAHRRQQKESEKADRAMKRATAAQVRLQRAGENATAKTKRNAQIQKQKAALDKNTTKGKGKTTAITKPAPNPNNTLVLTSAKITADTPDPRGYISIQDLIKTCADRGFTTKGKKKEQMVGELRDADEEWSLAELQKMCRSKGLNVSGGKVQLRYNLALAAAQVCKSFRVPDAAAAVNENVVMDEEE
jgi:flagellar biosynthesis GTPase FlhF